MNEINSGTTSMERLAQYGRVFGATLCLCMATLAVAQTPPAPSKAGGAVDGSNAATAGDRPAPTFWVAIPGNLFASLEKASPSGIFIETMDVLLKKAGFTPTYINMPTSDALRDVAAGTVSVATVVVPLPRIKDTAYFSDPVVSEHNIAVTLKDKGFNLSRVSDLRGKKTGARTGYQYPLLDKDQNIRLLRYQTDGEMLRALLFGQLDVAIISAISDIYAFRSEGIMTRMEILQTSVGVVPLVAAFSKKHFTQKNVAAFNQALAGFKQSPEWQELLEKNGMADLVKDWPMVTE